MSQGETSNTPLAVVRKMSVCLEKEGPIGALSQQKSGGGWCVWSRITPLKTSTSGCLENACLAKASVLFCGHDISITKIQIFWSQNSLYFNLSFSCKLIVLPKLSSLGSLELSHNAMCPFSFYTPQKSRILIILHSLDSSIYLVLHFAFSNSIS